jgi:hypothetical protein
MAQTRCLHDKIYIYKYMYIYIYVHIHIHTYMYIYIYALLPAAWCNRAQHLWVDWVTEVKKINQKKKEKGSNSPPLYIYDRTYVNNMYKYIYIHKYMYIY